MKASYNWLCALVPGLDASPSELAERFTRAGVAVDGIEEYGAGTERLVLAEVTKVEPHPKRDKLRLVTVDRGGSGDALQQRVVCGAHNVPDPGGMVALAPLGTILPAVNMTLTPREIAGVVSEGMLCSETEFGLVSTLKKDAEDPGILTFPNGFAKPGTPLRQAIPAVHDFIFELDLTPNRPDALGHIGLARDAAVLFGRTFGVPAPDSPARIAEGTTIGELVSITIDDTERCPHYGAAMVVDVTVGPSPLWLRYRLESLGVRSISNVVDVTNLVLLEFGHPMHAFDFDLVRGARIGVRRAAEGEAFTTLDGIAHRLVADDLVITDGEGPVALAGIMGGQNSEIRASTRRVLLECAYFAPRGVRRSSRRHAIHTESSHRFERGVDPSDIPDVLAHAASLLTQLAGGKAVAGKILAGVAPEEPRSVTLREKRMADLLGVHVPMAEASKILTGLGFEIHATRSEDAAGEVAEVLVPLHRPDIAGEADLIDEVIRVRGIDSLPAVLPAIRPQTPRSSGIVERRVRRAAIDVGLSEAVTMGFSNPKDLAALGLPPAAVTLVNPLGEERSAMRTTLLPGLFEALGRARRHGVGDVRLFTIGARFLASKATAPLPDEVLSFAAVIAGDRESVLSKPEKIDVYDAKGVALEIVARVSGRDARVEHQPADRRAPYLHPRAAGDVILGDAILGSFGLLHPDVVDAFDLGGPAVVIELDLRAIEALGPRAPRYRPIPALPAATRDIALVVHDDVTAGSVGDAIREAAGELCESVALFDLFRGGQVAADHQSLAFHVIYRDPKAASDPERARTLTDDEVDKRHQAVVDTVKKRFGAVLRA